MIHFVATEIKNFVVDSLEGRHRESVLLLAFGIKSCLRVEIFLVRNNCVTLVLSDAVESSPLLNALDKLVDGRRPNL